MITGTKGRSTTTAVLGHLLERLGHRVLHRRQYRSRALRRRRRRIALRLLGARGLELPGDRPRGVAVVVAARTSPHPDHLPWHGGEVEHAYGEPSACTQPGAEWTVANAACTASARRVTRSACPLGTGRTIALARLGGRPWPHRRTQPRQRRDRPRRDPVAGVDAASDFAALRDAAQRIRPPAEPADSHRHRARCRVRRRQLVDQACAHPRCRRRVAGRRIALIVGGEDRGIDYEPLAAGLARAEYDPLSVLTVPDSGARIAKVLGAQSIAVRECDDLTDAVRHGFVWAQPDGASCRSPRRRRASGAFTTIATRGDAFAAAMRACDVRCTNWSDVWC